MTQAINRYVQGVDPMDWNAVHDKIERNEEWAVVYDATDRRWEAWAEGRLISSCDTEAEATEIIEDELRCR